MKVCAWLIDFIHHRKNCPTGMISGWVQKVTQHNGRIQELMDFFQRSRFNCYFETIQVYYCVRLCTTVYYCVLLCTTVLCGCIFSSIFKNFFSIGVVVIVRLCGRDWRANCRGIRGAWSGDGGPRWHFLSVEEGCRAGRPLFPPWPLCSAITSCRSETIEVWFCNFLLVHSMFIHCSFMGEGHDVEK